MFEKWRKPGRHPKGQKGFKKIFSYMVFGAICLVFVFFIPFGTQILGEGVVAHVGSEVIRAGDFRFVEENIKAYYKDRPIPTDEEQALKMQQEIRTTTLRQLIDTRLIHQRSLKQGFSLSERELRATIKAQPAFQDPKTGRFLYSRYLQLLKANNLNPSRFEAIVEKSKTAENWQEMFEKASTSSRLERQKSSLRQKYQLSLRYVLMQAEDLEEELLIAALREGDQAKIKQFLKQHQLKWDKTGWFSPISAFGVPVSRNDIFMSAVLEALPNKGLIQRLVRDRDKIYLVDILDWKVEVVPKKDPLAQLLNFDSRSRLHDRWLQLEKQKVKIRISKSFQQSL